MELANDFRVNVYTGEPGRGHSPEQMAEMCVNSIMHVSATAHPAIREQAEQFKAKMQDVILQYMKKSVKSDRITVYNALKEAGHPELAEAIRTL